MQLAPLKEYQTPVKEPKIFFNAKKDIKIIFPAYILQPNIRRYDDE